MCQPTATSASSSGTMMMICTLSVKIDACSPPTAV
jgi:hypothetical protein